MRLVLLSAAAVACLCVSSAATVQASAPRRFNDGRRHRTWTTSSSPTPSLMAHRLYYYRYAPAIVLMTRSEAGSYSAAASAETREAGRRGTRTRASSSS